MLCVYEDFSLTFNFQHRMDSFTESPEFTNMVSSHQPVVTDQPTSNGQIFSREEEDSSSKNIEPVLIMELGDTVNIKMKLRRIDSYPGAKVHTGILKYELIIVFA